MILSKSPVLEIEDERLSTPSATKQSERPRTLEEMERNYILKVLQQTRWVIGGKRGAAEILKIHPNTLRSRLPKLGITRPE